MQINSSSSRGLGYAVQGDSLQATPIHSQNLVKHRLTYSERMMVVNRVIELSANEILKKKTAEQSSKEKPQGGFNPRSFFKFLLFIGGALATQNNMFKSLAHSPPNFITPEGSSASGEPNLEICSWNKAVNPFNPLTFELNNPVISVSNATYPKNTLSAALSVQSLYLNLNNTNQTQSTNSTTPFSADKLALYPSQNHVDPVVNQVFQMRPIQLQSTPSINSTTFSADKLALYPSQNHVDLVVNPVCPMRPIELPSTPSTNSTTFSADELPVCPSQNYVDPVVNPVCPMRPIQLQSTPSTNFTILPFPEFPTSTPPIGTNELLDNNNESIASRLGIIVKKFESIIIEKINWISKTITLLRMKDSSSDISTAKLGVFGPINAKATSSPLPFQNKQENYFDSRVLNRRMIGN